MILIKVKDYNELSEKACEIVVKEINRKPNFTIGFATGETPLGLYKELVKAYNKGIIDFSKVKTFNLDEYYSMKKKSKDSYYFYMFKNLFSNVNIKRKNISFLNGETRNSSKECLDYEKKIRKNPIELQILGVGVNGHIGFDEPGSDFNSKTRVIELSKETIKHNSKFFKNKKMPKRALTMGIKTIMNSKKIILLASGKEKRKAVNHLIHGKITKEWPDSILKKHKNFTLIADKAALGD